MKIGDKVKTPRFLTVHIAEVFEDTKEAYRQGFREPTYYDNDGYDVLGKVIDTNRMHFAAVRKTA